MHPLFSDFVGLRICLGSRYIKEPSQVKESMFWVKVFSSVKCWLAQMKLKHSQKRLWCTTLMIRSCLHKQTRKRWSNEPGGGSTDEIHKQRSGRYGDILHTSWKRELLAVIFGLKKYHQLQLRKWHVNTVIRCHLTSLLLKSYKQCQRGHSEC